MNFSSTSNTGPQRYLYFLFQNQYHSFLLPLFFEEYLNPQVRIKKLAKEHSVVYHISPLELTSRRHLLIFLWTPKGFISAEYFLNFFSNWYIPMRLWKKIKFMVLRLLENTFVSQKKKKKIKMYIFKHAANQNSHLGSYHYPPGRRKFPQTAFSIFSPQQKGGRIWELKNCPKLNLRGYWSQVSINSTSLQPLHIWFLFQFSIIKIQSC